MERYKIFFDLCEKADDYFSGIDSDQNIYVMYLRLLNRFRTPIPYGNPYLPLKTVKKGVEIKLLRLQMH